MGEKKEKREEQKETYRQQGVAAKFIELSSLCTRSRARFPRFYAFHRLFFCVLFLFGSFQPPFPPPLPPRYHERNVRRRRKRPATVEDISRVVYDSLRKEFNGVDVWILRFCVKVGYEDGVWKYWYSHWREREKVLIVLWLDLFRVTVCIVIVV